jgi:hypothetical protein
VRSILVRFVGLRFWRSACEDVDSLILGGMGWKAGEWIVNVDKVSSVTFRGNHRLLYHLDTWRSSKLVAVALREYRSWAEDLASHQTSSRYTRLTSVTADCVKPRVASMMQIPQ